jgi:hypothetical protein
MNQNISCTDDEAADEVRRDLLGLVCALAGDNDIEEDGITNPVLPLLRHNNDVEASCCEAASRWWGTVGGCGAACSWRRART